MRINLGILSLSLLMCSPAEAVKIFIEKRVYEPTTDTPMVHEPIALDVITALRAILVAEYETRVLVEVPDSSLDEFNEGVLALGLGYYSRPEFDRIQINGYNFDSLGGAAPDLPGELSFSDYQGDVGLYLIQMVGPPLPEWVSELRDEVGIVRYFAENTFLVRARPGTQDALISHPHIQYEGVLQPAFKVHPALRDLGRESVPTVIQIDEGQESTSLEAFLGEILGRPVSIPKRGPYINYRATLDLTEIAAIAARPEVLWVGPYGAPAPSDERHAMVVAGQIDGARPNTPNQGVIYEQWLEDKGLCATATSPKDCINYFTKVGVFDTGLDSNSCNYGLVEPVAYDLDQGTCYDVWGSPFWQKLRHPDFGGDGVTSRQENFFCIPKTDEFGNDIDACSTGVLSDLKCHKIVTLPQGSQHQFSFSDVNNSVHHGTKVASLVVGSAADGSYDSDNAGYFEGWGMAPRARLVTAKILYNTGNNFGSVGYGCVMSLVSGVGTTFANNSWNQSLGMDNEPADITDYSEMSQLMDSLVRDSDLYDEQGQEDYDEPMTIVFSAGNLGDLVGNPSSLVQAPGNSKNTISVGASEGWEGLNEVDRDCCDNFTTGPFPCHPCQGPGGSDHVGHIFGYSLRGTPDGRFKPDLLAPGTRLRGALSMASNGSGMHECFGGTSGAAPLVTGSAVLIDAWYKANYPSQDDPSPALLKAMLIAHADDLVGGLDWLPEVTGDESTPPVLEHSPSTPQGWGRVNLDVLLPDGGGPAIGRLLYDEDDGSVPGNVERRFSGSLTLWTENLQVVEPTEDLILVLAYTDAPGSLGAGLALVNNLDLMIVDGSGPGSSKYYGNKFEVGDFYSERFPGSLGWGAPDHINNVEVIRVPGEDIDNGDFSIRVSAETLGGVGVPAHDNGAFNQDFALYIVNAVGAGP